jgi:hypothetical protein
MNEKGQKEETLNSAPKITLSSTFFILFYF